MDAGEGCSCWYERERERGWRAGMTNERDARPPTLPEGSARGQTLRLRDGTPRQMPPPRQSTAPRSTCTRRFVSQHEVLLRGCSSRRG